MGMRRVARATLGLATRRVVRPALPLSARKRLVVEAGRRRLPGRSLLAVELLRDLAQDDPVAFHHFLWENHVAYAESYELGRFEAPALEEDRRLLFELLCSELRRQGAEPTTDVRSVLDAGCSLGYVLRHAETSVFPAAESLTGIDIDARAVASGAQHLRRIGSRIELRTASLEELDQALQEQIFDVVISCGALMYLDQSRATRAVASLLQRAGRVVGLIDRAHPDRDNSTLAASTVRRLDQTLIHDLDGMVRAAGGIVRERVWQPPRSPDDRGLYVVVATPADLPA
jgi:SAM-dependent methyltransferase